MNIIEVMKSILAQFPKISVTGSEINIDLTGDDPTSFVLSSVGDRLVYEDVLGGQTRQHSFLLYAVFSGINDYERIENSSALTELSVWLSTSRGDIVTTMIGNEECTGELLSVTADNGRLYAVEEDNTITGMRYQMTVEAQYTVDI